SGAGTRRGERSGRRVVEDDLAEVVPVAAVAGEQRRRGPVRRGERADQVRGEGVIQPDRAGAGVGGAGGAVEGEGQAGGVADAGHRGGPPGGRGGRVPG